MLQDHHTPTTHIEAIVAMLTSLATSVFLYREQIAEHSINILFVGANTFVSFMIIRGLKKYFRKKDSEV